MGHHGVTIIDNGEKIDFMQTIIYFQKNRFQHPYLNPISHKKQ